MIRVILDLQLVGVLEVFVEEVDQILELSLALTYVLNLYVVVLQILNLLVEHHQVKHDQLVFDSWVGINEDAVLFDLVKAPAHHLVDVELLDAALHNLNELARRRVNISKAGGNILRALYKIVVLAVESLQFEVLARIRVRQYVTDAAHSHIEFTAAFLLAADTLLQAGTRLHPTQGAAPLR